MRAFVLVSLLSACAAREQAAFVPALVLRGQISADATDWRVEAALALRDRDPIVGDPDQARSPRVHAAWPCADAVLCAWERRASVEAMQRLERGE